MNGYVQFVSLVSKGEQPTKYQTQNKTQTVWRTVAEQEINITKKDKNFREKDFFLIFTNHKKKTTEKFTKQ